MTTHEFFLHRIPGSYNAITHICPVPLFTYITLFRVCTLLRLMYPMLVTYLHPDSIGRKTERFAVSLDQGLWVDDNVIFR